ncbi:hypothetical protein [Litorivicinus lipolyticus]|uniref:hypothetical protein n=1 Tax=Litorivicinus lipolyticus TaxID=418701 RepID=UPI003B59FD5C
MSYPWHQPQLDQLAQDTRVQSVLVTSAPGQGVAGFAEALTRVWMCESGTECGQCRGCRFLAQDAHPDVFTRIPEGASHTHQIDAIRALVQASASTTHQGGGRVIRIFEAERMNISSANALLKLLEEPPAGTRFILTTERPGRLPPTVLSRVRKVVLPSLGDVAGWLASTFPNQDTSAARGVSAAPDTLRQLMADPEALSQRDEWRQGLIAAHAGQRKAGALIAAAQRLNTLVWFDDWYVLALERIKAEVVRGQTPYLAALCTFVERLERERKPALQQVTVDTGLVVQALGDLWVRAGRLST